MTGRYGRPPSGPIVRNQGTTRRRNHAAQVQRRSAAEICRDASGEAVAAAYSRLGPITGGGEALEQAGGTDSAMQLAAEQIVHLQDAWRYFSSAVTAYLRNSPSNATHLAYYCELRCAMSLFAGSGIRIMKGDTFLLDISGTRKPFVAASMATHSLTWALWQEWVLLPAARNLIGDEVKLMPGLSLKDVALVPDGASALLKQWGYDFLMLADDKEARNSASYEAKANQPMPQMLDGAPGLVKKLWSLLITGGQGVIFDVALIRYFVDLTIQQQVAADEADGGNHDAAHFLSGIIKSTVSQSGVDESSLQALMDGPVDTSVFSLAAENQAATENILARALVLLRFASLAVNRSFAQVPDNAGKTWMRNWLEAVGLFNPALEDPADLVVDYQDAVEEFFPLNGVPLPASLWQGDALKITSTLTQLEASVGWGMALG